MDGLWFGLGFAAGFRLILKAGPAFIREAGNSVTSVGTFCMGCIGRLRFAGAIAFVSNRHSDFSLMQVYCKLKHKAKKI